MPNKVFCEGCLCVSENEYTDLCNLGYKLRLQRNPVKGYDYVSDDCELEFVRYAGGEFRPTLRATDAGNSAEISGSLPADNLSNSDGSAVPAQRG